MIDKLFKLQKYIPIALLSMYFISDSEMSKHMKYKSCAIIIDILCILIFLFLAYYLKIENKYALLFAIILWAILHFIRNMIMK